MNGARRLKEKFWLYYGFNFDELDEESLGKWENRNAYVDVWSDQLVEPRVFIHEQKITS